MSKIRFCLITGMVAAGIMVTSHGVAFAADPQMPQAEVKIIHAGPASLQWNAQGRTSDGVAICVSSTSGHYELTVKTASGQGLVGSTQLPYTVTFESDGVKSTAVVSSATPQARFEGFVDPTRDCSAGANARLVLSLDPRGALAGNAGDYSDSLVLGIEAR